MVRPLAPRNYEITTAFKERNKIRGRSFPKVHNPTTHLRHEIRLDEHRRRRARANITLPKIGDQK